MADQKNRLGFSIFFFESVRVREIGQSTTDSEKEGGKRIFGCAFTHVMSRGSLWLHVLDHPVQPSRASLKAFWYADSIHAAINIC